ncbi:5038_t:CDS:2 [Funneliformis caledonium]|uniref:5038_t:CDS:1 n=1 Tax=Funneliformis caledonium TaxID=1117310 RepID=A0A9N9H0F0_9GLOM|nr:5038_t:CDS:2 [Funneliformis caledonium]
MHLEVIPLDRYQKLDILKMLQVVVTFFDMDLIRLVPLCCFKKATIPVNSKSEKKIPREKVSKDGDYVHRYIDIVINGNEENIVLELVTTANQSNLEEHFNHALSYGNNLTATAIWIVHFTCENRYCKAENPMYQSEE